MNLTLLIGVFWIGISVLNYMYYIPDEQKKKTGLVAFIGFAIISPLVTIVVYTIHYLRKLLTW